MAINQVSTHIQISARISSVQQVQLSSGREAFTQVLHACPCTPANNTAVADVASQSTLPAGPLTATKGVAAEMHMLPPMDAKLAGMFNILHAMREQLLNALESVVQPAQSNGMLDLMLTNINRGQPLDSGIAVFAPEYLTAMQSFINVRRDELQTYSLQTLTYQTAWLQWQVEAEAEISEA